jgi:hypothetical protein
MNFCAIHSQFYPKFCTYCGPLLVVAPVPSPSGFPTGNLPNEPKPRKYEKGKKTKMSDEQITNMLNAYYLDSMTADEVATKYGISKAAFTII